MVFLTALRFAKASKDLTKRDHYKFIDSLKLFVNGGHGGNGLPKYGGVGGQGGCVAFEAKEKVQLKNIARKNSDGRLIARNGEDSTKHRLIGKRGADVVVQVPTGITIIDEKGQEIAELNNVGDKVIAAGGGGGGCSGNNFIGGRGQSRIITLDLKLIADIGFVGFPNAGKSTLLRAISNASPKIASYPFTTIRPHIGTIEYPDLRQISAADLPGLIEGAHANIGMGHKFLKHVERTRLLVMIVDLFGFKLKSDVNNRTCLENIFALNKELELYDSSLLQKPCILLLNKTDADGALEEYEKIKDKVTNLKEHLDECPEQLVPEEVIKFSEILTISAKTRTGIDDVKLAIRTVLDEYAKQNLSKRKPNQDNRKMMKVVNKY